VRGDDGDCFAFQSTFYNWCWFVFFILFFFLLSVCKACVWDVLHTQEFEFSLSWIHYSLFCRFFWVFGNASDCFNWHPKQKPVKKKDGLAPGFFVFSILWVRGLMIIHKRT
jgi:hypothetical protein